MNTCSQAFGPVSFGWETNGSLCLALPGPKHLLKMLMDPFFKGSVVSTMHTFPSLTTSGLLNCPLCVRFMKFVREKSYTISSIETIEWNAFTIKQNIFVLKRVWKQKSDRHEFFINFLIFWLQIWKTVLSHFVSYFSPKNRYLSKI